MLQSEIAHTGLMAPTGSCASSLSDFGWPPLAVAVPATTFDLSVQRTQIHNSARSTSCSLDDGRNNWMQQSHYQPQLPFYGSASSVGQWYSQYPPHHHQQQPQQQQQQQRSQESTNVDRHWVSDPINLSMTSGSHHLPTTNFVDRNRYSRVPDDVCSTALLPSTSRYASENDRRCQAVSAIAADVISSDTARVGVDESSATASKQFYVTPPSAYEPMYAMQSRASSYGRPASGDSMAARWYDAYFPVESVPSTTSYSSSSNRHRLTQLQRPNEAASSLTLTSSVSAPSLCRTSRDAFAGHEVDAGLTPQPHQPMVMPSRDHLSRSSRYAATMTSSSSSGSRQTLQFKEESSEDADEDDDEDGQDKHRFAFGFRPTAASMSIGKTRTREKYRTVYNERQKINLEAEYLKNPYISAERKASISQASGLSQRQVKIWFQNRRAKDRRTRYRTSAHCTSTSN